MFKFIDNNKAAILSGDPTMDPGFDEYDIKEDSKMTTGKLKELMLQYCIVDSELDDIFAFVTDLLYLQRRELEEREPYATRTINEIYRAEVMVDDLINYVSELEEEEDNEEMP